ncbi:hypothetical protein [Halobacteriaceae bacterium SHR40]|uniref:hypothetical protein n=1 Tax=Halovenus amylolytica TaxID=2500550 RepID=UPI000FE37287
MADGDPYELFRRTLQGFDSSGNPFDPSGFGRFGWPMTPLPVQGMSGAEMTPEAGTKRAVTQLYRSIEALDEQLFSGSIPESWQQALSGFTSDPPDRVVAMLLGTYQVWLHNLSQLLVEGYTIQILYEELVVPAHRDEVGTSEWMLTLSQSDREQLLLRCTDIDDDLVADMEDLRTRRNELLFSMGSWDDLALDTSVEDGRRYVELLADLDEIAADGTGYQFLSEA